MHAVDTADVLCVIDTARMVCRERSMKLSGVRLSVRLSVCLSVCLSVRPIFGRRTYAAAADLLLLFARRPGDIDRLLHDRRSAANVSSATLSADAGS